MSTNSNSGNTGISGNSNPNNTTTSNNPTIVGINSQPYRSYLTDRNHFYHSASVTNPSTQFGNNNSTNTTSGGLHSSMPATVVSHYTTSSGAYPQSAPISKQSSNNNTTTSQLYQQHQQQQHLANSRQSLNSASSTNHQSSIHHQQQRSGNMLKSSKRSPSTNSSTMPIGSGSSVGGNGSKTMIDTDEDDEYQLNYHNRRIGGKPSACSKCIFGFLWCLAQIGLWGAVLLLVYWFLKFDKGFAFQNDKRKQFNLHAFLMLTGFIFVNGQSMLIYKTYMCCKKIYNKITHAIFFVISISLVSFGMLIAIQGQHITAPDQSPVHFYSLHSWIGLVTCGLFALQFFFGFITFLVLLCCERATSGYRARFLPIHVTFGLIIFMLACATCLSGLLQTARSRLSGPTPTEPTKPDYRDMSLPDNNPLNNSGLVLNAVGGCLILLAVLIPYLVRNFNFNRRHDVASFRVNH